MFSEELYVPLIRCHANVDNLPDDDDCNDDEFYDNYDPFDDGFGDEDDEDPRELDFE